MKPLYEIHDEIERLAEYVRWDGTDSQTESLGALINLASCPYCLSDAASASIASEILSHLDYYVNNTEIVEEEKTIIRTIKEVIHK